MLGVSEHFSRSLPLSSPSLQVSQSSVRGKHVAFQDLLKRFPATDANNAKLLPDENKSIDDLKNGFESRFKDVVNHQKLNLTAIPERFRLSEKAISLSIHGLEQRIKTERSKQGQSRYVSEQIDKMENIVKNMKGDVAENQVYSALRKLWNGKRGVLIHSFKPEDVLAPLNLH